MVVDIRTPGPLFYKIGKYIRGSEINSTYNFEELSNNAVGLFEPSEVKIRRYSLFVADMSNHLVGLFDLYRKSAQYIDHQGMRGFF